MVRKNKILTMIVILSLVFTLSGCRKEYGIVGTVPTPNMEYSNETIPPRDHLELSLDLVSHLSSDKRDFVLMFDEWKENETVSELIRVAKNKPIEMELVYLDNYALMGELGFTLPSNDEEITVQPNDVVLFEGNKILICYQQHKGKYTLLTHGKGQAGDNYVGGIQQYYKEILQDKPSKMKIDAYYG